MERLFINGQEVDVTGSGITFTLKSNLLGEFGKIVAGNSQTVKLPRTVRNMKVLDVPEVPSRSGTMVRRKLTARLERNGVPMIEDGEAVILSTSKDGYEVGITYGVVSFLSLVKDGGNLNELPDEGEALVWNADSLANTPINARSMYYGFGKYDNGVNDTSIINVHPVVSLGWVLDKIQARYGFTIDFDNDDIVDMVKTSLYLKYMLLTERNDSKAVLREAVGRYSLSEYLTPIYQYGDETTFTLSGSAVLANYGVTVERSTGHIVFGRAVQSFKMMANIYAKGFGDDSRLYVMKSYDGVGVSPSAVVYEDVIDSSSMFYFNASLNVPMAEGDYLVVKIVAKGEWSVILLGGELQMSGLDYVWAEGEEPSELEYPSASYPIVPNLPSMKVADFIQLCGVLTGRFPMVNKGEKDVLHMVSVEDLLEAKSEAVDWSDKWSGKPDSVEYKYLDAVKNFIRWEADEDVEKSGVPTDGYVSVDDETLEVWNDLIKLPLSGSNGGVIPQYSVVDGKLEENSVSERILTLDSETNEVAYTSDLWPQTLVSTVLAGYQRLVREPVVLKGTFRLTELDIRWLDYMKPVYLRQMGRYYGIVQVQYKGDESVVELLQLPI